MPGSDSQTSAADAMHASGELFTVIDNRIEAIPPLAARIEGFLLSFGVPGQAIFRINLAIDELLTNVISYGYQDDARHVIRVTVGVAAGTVLVDTEDDAAAFDPFARDAIDTAAPIDHRRPGGLGIHLVKEMIEDVAYQRIGGRNRITMRQSLAVTGDNAALIRSKDE